MDPGPAPPPSSPAAARTMRRNRRRDTGPELAVRRALHAAGLRFLVDVPVPGCGRRRRADVLLRGSRIVLHVHGCFWHSTVERDRDTDAQVRRAGWLPLRVWEHDPVPGVVARVAHLAALRRLDGTAVEDVGLFDRG